MWLDFMFVTYTFILILWISRVICFETIISRITIYFKQQFSHAGYACRFVYVCGADWGWSTDIQKSLQCGKRHFARKHNLFINYTCWLRYIDIRGPLLNKWYCESDITLKFVLIVQNILFACFDVSSMGALTIWKNALEACQGWK